MCAVCVVCTKATSRRRSACMSSSTQYCSTDCQKSHWPEHRFTCDPARGLITVEHLVRSLHRGVFPDDQQTVVDYGIGYPSKSCTQEFIATYVAITIGLEVPASRLHKWQVSGQLFEKLSEKLGESLGHLRLSDRSRDTYLALAEPLDARR